MAKKWSYVWDFLKALFLNASFPFQTLSDALKSCSPRLDLSDKAIQ